MNAEQIKLVQATFNDIQPIAVTAAELFYGRLFALDPTLRPLFKGDMVHQGRMLMWMLNSTVKGLNDLGTLVPVLHKLGARHVGYGVRDEHYATVGSALLWTLEKGLCEKFTPTVRDAWATAYDLLADTMQGGAVQAASRQAVPA